MVPYIFVVLFLRIWLTIIWVKIIFVVIITAMFGLWRDLKDVNFRSLKVCQKSPTDFTAVLYYVLILITTQIVLTIHSAILQLMPIQPSSSLSSPRVGHDMTPVAMWAPAFSDSAVVHSCSWV